MTISEWIKSKIKSDTDQKLTSRRHRTNQINKNNHICGCKRYINPKKRVHTVCIVKKCPSCIQLPKVICTAFPYLSPYKRSNIHCKPQKFSVDSDSFTIGIDNHASTKISNWSSHFIGTMTPVKGKKFKGFGGVVQVKGEGAIVWKIEDDDGIVHPIKIKKALCVPETLSFLLVPQQWEQQDNENYPKPDGTWCTTKAHHCILYCRQEWYRRTISWDTSINIARIRSDPSSNNYRVFVTA